MEKTTQQNAGRLLSLMVSMKKVPLFGTGDNLERYTKAKTVPVSSLIASADLVYSPPHTIK